MKEECSPVLIDKNMTLLSICIPTITERQERFEVLYNHLEKMATGLPVEVIYLSDNRAMSIGKKRDLLYKMAKGKYAVQVDDDDRLSESYLDLVLPALEKEPECVGYLEKVVGGKRPGTSIISLRNKEWRMTRENGQWMYYRTPFFKVPIKTSICVKTGVPDLRYGEDHEFSKLINNQLFNEVFIDEFCYIYHAPTFNGLGEMNERYGLQPE